MSGKPRKQSHATSTRKLSRFRQNTSANVDSSSERIFAAVPEMVKEVAESTTKTAPMRISPSAFSPAGRSVMA